MQNILVVGGSSGIGLELTNLLAQNNNRVYATYNKTVRDNSSEFISYRPLNVLEENITLDFLPEALDGFVYCPGSINLKPFARIKPEEFEKDFTLSVTAAVKILQLILPRLKKSNQASVIFFSTVAVQLGLNFHTQVAASKGAVEGLTRALAAELAPAIRVNCIAPSLTETNLSASLLNTPEKREAGAQRHPLKRTGTVNDMAQMAAFLLSEKSSWITGQVLKVDGGMSTLRV